MTNNSFFAPFAPKTYKNKKMSIARHLIASFVFVGVDGLATTQTKVCSA